MFGRGLRLFTLIGFEVRIDWSWLFLALLLTWSLGMGVFPAFYPGLAMNTYWLMGIVGALGLFGSIILHELGHSLAARRFGIPMRGITLFIFGGVAEMGSPPPSAKSEFFMAIAGPIVSL
ncbi:MAG TPA: site-2 protease family protein, partial [Verrucomicrobiota bacterium]|nr:site-2 protease family protein [Verrucomicrobiota bacterium]